uniref:MIP20172p n=1 Tax=Drosophila melanogaster TaxID=7227 RepID=D5A7P9_DROME|nr:MIP20172p [Drosophila melanogaster]
MRCHLQHPDSSQCSLECLVYRQFRISEWTYLIYPLTPALQSLAVPWMRCCKRTLACGDIERHPQHTNTQQVNNGRGVAYVPPCV